MARYRKIDPRMWKDENFRKLSRDEKLIAVYIITAQSNRVGLFNFSPAMAREDLDCDEETFGKRFGNVCQTLNWGWDLASRTIYIPTWFRYNCPENPNVLKGCLTDLAELPQTPLLEQFCVNLAYVPETLHQTFREGLPKRLPKRLANQEQEQEQEQEQDVCPPPAVESKTAHRSAKQRPRDALFDAVADIAGADPRASGSHIGRVVAALLRADPPYTAEEVRALPDAIARQRWPAFTMTLGAIEKHIGLVRRKPAQANGEAATGLAHLDSITEPD